MITVDSQRQHENIASSVKIAPRSHASSVRLRKTLRRHSMLRLRDKIRLWRDKGYLTDAVAIAFLFGILLAAFYWGIAHGAGR